MAPIKASLKFIEAKTPYWLDQIACGEVHKNRLKYRHCYPDLFQTRLFVTGVEAYLAQADCVIVVENGSIMDMGTVMDLVTGPTKAATFLKSNIPNPTMVSEIQTAEDLNDDDSCENSYQHNCIDFYIMWNFRCLRMLQFKFTFLWEDSSTKE